MDIINNLLDISNLNIFNITFIENIFRFGIGDFFKDIYDNTIGAIAEEAMSAIISPILRILLIIIIIPMLPFFVFFISRIYGKYKIFKTLYNRIKGGKKKNKEKKQNNGSKTVNQKMMG